MRIRRQLEFFFCNGQKKKAAGDEAAAAEGQPTQLDEKLTDECVGLARELDVKNVAQRIRVVWNSRMRSSAGRAFWPEAKIELNPRLWEVAPDQIRRTMLHELAHLLAYARAGRRTIAAHGEEWRRACTDLGIPGESATHDLPLPFRKMRRKWRYHCPGCGEGFERVRKMKRYAGCYHCCKEYNGGYYHRKFRLIETRLE